MIKIQTLDEILAEMGEPVSAKPTSASSKKPQSTIHAKPTPKTKIDGQNSASFTLQDDEYQDITQTINQDAHHNIAPNPKIKVPKKASKDSASGTASELDDGNLFFGKGIKSKKSERTVRQSQNTQSQTSLKKASKVHSLTANPNSAVSEFDEGNLLLRKDITKLSHTTDNTLQSQTKEPIVKDNLEQDGLAQNNLEKILASTPQEPLMINDRANNRLRWLAFYYLSRGELSTHELRQKLLNKDQDPDAVEALLIEFAEKGYQSDERCAYMLIREAVRKGRGKRHIEQAFRQARLSLPHSLNELIAEASHSLTDGTVLADDDTDSINWLKLAVEARTKKYGDTIPKDPKEKARQLRFLQYRGFDTGVCFDALKMRLTDFE